MKKLILILVMIILNFTACSNKNSIEASYIKIDNKNLLFGDKKSKNKFQFTEKENGHISKNLIIYFNNDDFKSESMDLCRKTGEYDLLKNVKEDSNGNKYPTFEKNKIDCHSFVHINKFAKIGLNRTTMQELDRTQKRSLTGQ